MGWTRLIIANVIGVGLILYAFYYYTIKYSPTKIKSTSNNLTGFVSELYFNEKDRFIEVFYKTPNNKKTHLAHSGYVLVRVLIFGSFLATVHNLCQFYNISFYNSSRDLVGRPLYFIYGLVIISFFYFSYRLWVKEYRQEIITFGSDNY